MLEKTRRAPAASAAALPAWRFWAALGAQLLLVATIPLPKALAYATGTPVLLRTAPVDPLDILRGRYATLAFEIARPEAMKQLPGWQAGWSAGKRELYWTLAPGKPGEAWRAVAIADRFPATLPDHDVVLAGRYSYGHADFGLEEYYVPERSGNALGDAMRAPKAAPLAEAKVDAYGTAVLTGVLVGGQRF